MKKRCLLLFVLAFIFSIQTTLSFAEETDPVTVISVEEYDEFFPYSQAVAALTIEYGVGDDAVPLESVDDIGGAFATRRIIVRTTDQKNDWVGAVRVLHFEDEYVLQFETEAETEKAYEILRADETYQGVYLDKIVQQEPVEADAVIASSLNGDQAHYSWGVQKMGLDVMENRLNEAGYGQADNNPAVVVAVVDTGVSNNRYINGRLVTGYNYVSQNTNTGDDEGHGTHVAGTICDGTPQRVKILPVKVLDSSGRGTSTNIKNGVEYAISQGVDVINLSLGRDDTAQMSDYLDATLQKAYQRGITVVVAAGNSSMDTQYSYPANNPNVLTIAALDENMTLADYSNYGYDVDFALPGSNIESCIPTGMDVISGTSMAAPHAAAAVADLKCWNPDYDPDTIKTILVNSSVDLGDSYLYGNGWINFSDFYIVQYNSNEGNGSPGIQIKNPGSALVLSSAIPTRESHDAVSCSVTLDANGGSVSPTSLTANRSTIYTFKNWNTKADGTGTSYASGATYSVDEDLTLYAQWNSSTTTSLVTLPTPTHSSASAGSYTVTLDANGGSVSPASLTANRTITYTFKNWNTKSDGTGTSYASGATYSADADVTLYAQWNSSSSTVSVTLPTPTRSGYSFKGWGTSSTATTGVTGSYTPSGNMILYALWEISKYTVTFNANGGSGVPANQTKIYNQNITLSSTQPTHSSTSAGSYTVTLNANGGSVSPSYLAANRTTSYTFKSWNTKADGTGTSYASGAIYSADADVTLYAQWNSNITTSSVILPTPSRSGYTFKGWGTSSTATTGMTGSYTPTANVTLYAAWENDEIASGYWGQLRWGLDKNGLLTISGNTTMKDFSFSKTEAWHKYRSEIETVFIQSGVRSISKYAFLDCSSLTSITIPGSVTSIEVSSAFSGCEGLASIEVSQSSQHYSSANGVLLSKDCTELICFPKGRTGSYILQSSVTSIGEYAFSRCSGLTSVTIPSSVTSIGEYAFSRCSGLTSVTIPPSVTSIGNYAFYICSGLTSVTIPSSVTSIEQCAFGSCSSLTSVTIPDSVTSIEDHAFSYSGLTSITLPESLRTIGFSAFQGCSSLTSLTIPSGVSLIYEWTFEDCIGLKRVMIPSSMEEIRDKAFQGCSSLTDIYYEGSPDQWRVLSIGRNGNDALRSARHHFNFTGIPAPDLILPASLTTIEEGAFSDGAFVYVKLPEGTESIQARVFANCPNLKFIYVPESTTTIDQTAFENVSDLTVLGKKGSRAENFANSSGFAFMELQ